MVRTKVVQAPSSMAPVPTTGAVPDQADIEENRARRGRPKGPGAYAPLEWPTPLPTMEQYLRHLYGEGRQITYVTAVRRGLTHFTHFIIAEHGGVITPEKITRADLVRFRGYVTGLKNREGEPFSRRYINQLLKYVRAWLNYLVEEEVLEESPWRNIKIRNIPKEPSPLSLEEIAQLFDAHRRQAFAIDAFMYHRREVILTLLLGWGLRIHELAALDVQRLDVRLNSVRVVNKGGGTKDLPYGPEMKGVVVRYLGHRARIAERTETALLVDSINGTRLSIGSIRTIVTSLGETAGVHLKPHQLRDSYGTALVNEHVPVEEIMALLGHRSRAQTMQYVRLVNPTIAASHARVMSPLLGHLLSGDDR